MNSTADPPGLPARRAALRLLDTILRSGHPLEAALAKTTGDLAKPEDKALARAVASETLRHLRDLDDLIDGATRQRLPDDAKARMVLRLALAQALAMKTPPHAAIATALPLVEGGPRRLVHGVLGALLRAGVSLPDPPSLPEAVERRWRLQWGDEAVADARAALAEPPPLGLTFRDGRASATVAAGTDVTALPGFGDGEFWVQNVSASIPATLLGAGQGRTVLDLCAAPGGKTMQLAAAGWDAVAIDRDADRLERLKRNLTRTKLTARTITGDILKWQPPAPVDAILLDAPCSATGIFSRHPDVLHRVRQKDIAQLADLQKRMLARAAHWLKPGGVLVFSTCSLESQEGEDHLNERPLLTLSPIGENELPQPFVPDHGGWLRILPRPGVDGFFIARFMRS